MALEETVVPLVEVFALRIKNKQNREKIHDKNGQGQKCNVQQSLSTFLQLYTIVTFTHDIISCFIYIYTP